jgi:hypothetical protein
VAELDQKVAHMTADLATEKEKASRAETEAMNERVRVERLQAELEEVSPPSRTLT